MAVSEQDWLPLPDVAERLDLPLFKVRRMVEERHLAGRRVDGVFRIPPAMLDQNAVVRDVAGTLTVLIDGGFSEEGALDWLLSESDVLGVSPLEALRSGRKSEVRRLAQSLAF